MKPADQLTERADADLGATASLNAVRTRFSLRAVFLSVTYFAIASAFAMRWGVGVFAGMTGIYLTWASFRGYLTFLQTRPARPKVLGLAWLLFGVSLGLPALTITGCGNPPQPKTYAGWETAVMAVQIGSLPFQDGAQLISDPTYRTAEHYRHWAATSLWSLLANLPNGMLILSPWVYFRLRRGRGAFLAACFGCAAVSTWIWGIGDSASHDRLRVGYYVWSAAITLIFLMWRPGLKTLLAMTLVGLLAFLSHWLDA